MKKNLMNKYKTFQLSLFLILFIGSTYTSRAQVNWMSFEEAIEKSKIEKKKIFIDVYTDWCGWCKVMDKNTFSLPLIADYLNENYYAVKFNAEQREEITFRDHAFKFVPSGAKGYHELAAALLQNKLSYPTFVILNEEFEIVNITPGYTKPEPFHKIISFYNLGSYKSKELAAKFEQQYKSPTFQ
jgi:thioredoxin-related protein